MYGTFSKFYIQMSTDSEKLEKKVGFQSNNEEEKQTIDEKHKPAQNRNILGYNVKVAVPSKIYGNNKKNSSQYTGLLFIPLNLYQQLKNPVFQFYLLIMILEIIPGISITDQLPRTLYPYLIIMIIQMIVDYLVTFKVNKIDNIQNKIKVKYKHLNSVKYFHFIEINHIKILTDN